MKPILSLFTFILFLVLIPIKTFADWHIMMMTTENGLPTEKHVYITDFQIISKTEFNILIYDKITKRVFYSSLITRTKWEGTKSEYDSLVKLGVNQSMELSRVKTDSAKSAFCDKAYSILNFYDGSHQGNKMNIKLIDENYRWTDKQAKLYGLYLNDSLVTNMALYMAPKKLLKQLAEAEKILGPGTFSLNNVNFYKIKKLRKLTKKNLIVSVLENNPGGNGEKMVMQIVEEKVECMECNELKDFKTLFLNEIIVEDLKYKMGNR